MSVARSLSPFVEPGVVLRTYTKDEAVRWVEQWLEVFGQERQGVNAKAYLWHVFSAGRFPAVEGRQAHAIYAEQRAPEYVVLANNREDAVLTDLLPTAALPSDWLVFPVNLAWTMAFTHEEGRMGPYFAKHANYERLRAENLARIDKRDAIALAKQKGWA